MIESNKIQIENIYYMLCYSWDRLEYLDRNYVGQLQEKNILNLLTLVFQKEVNLIIKKGLYREYVVEKEECSVIKGKIGFNESLSLIGKRSGKLVCEYDDMSYNVQLNRIIKTTIINILKVKEVAKNDKKVLKASLMYFSDINKITLTENVFKNIKYNKINKKYNFVINICELINNNLLLSKDGKDAEFYNFIEDDKKMSLLFESFVRNFYKTELHKVKVYRENINWRLDGLAKEYLPIMQTDISLEWKDEDRKIIIDTKYYREAMKSYRGSEKLRTANLYQLFSYLKNIEMKSEKDRHVDGILLYPKVDKELNLNYSMEDHNISIYTVNLNCKWQDIHSRLLEIVN
ncbi:5-methylcytosine restriction system specificity protein McrC [Clostridium tagluense]|uniref:5-methylcytosine restriction system specificity protein McrC n=1 Tax=Clostridium tagluense TaxID=360422 RepID=UPI001C0E096E|nr:hypothetical protein [Clostridium tagluense]MBU3130460.1 hypothetical protein [Clostridium tagluense]